MKPYAVVKFGGKEETLAVVPSSWINEDKLSCKWPPKKFSNNKIMRFIMSLKEPTSEFNNYPATVMHEYDKYRNALKACKLAEDNSDLDTAAEETNLEKPRKKRKIISSYEKSNSEELNDEPSEKAKKMSKKFIHSDSDEDNEILNAQEITERFTELLNKKGDFPKKSNENKIIDEVIKLLHRKKDWSKKNNESGNLPVKNSFLKCDEDNIIHNTSVDFNVALKDVTLRTKQHSNNSLPASEESEPIASSSQLETNILSEYDSNSDEIFSERDTHYNIKAFFAKPSNIQVSSAIQNENKCGNCNTLLKVVIQLKEEITETLDHVNMSLLKVYRKLDLKDPAFIKPIGLSALPLKDEEAFREFEEFLKIDDNFFLTIDYLMLLMPIRKSKEKVLVGKFLGKIFSNSLAKIINYSDSGCVKLKLQDTNILTAIECAIIKKIPSCDVTEVHSKIIRWLISTSNQKMTACADEIENATSLEGKNTDPVGFIRKADNTLQIHLGRNVWLPKVTYESAICTKSHMMVVKNLALAVFGHKVLQASSISGNTSNKYKNREPKKKLDETKVLAIQDIYRYWLINNQKYTEYDARIESRKVSLYISKKISELNRNKLEKKTVKEANNDDRNSIDVSFTDTQEDIEATNVNSPANKNGLKWIEIFFHPNA